MPLLDKPDRITCSSINCSFWKYQEKFNDNRLRIFNSINFRAGASIRWAFENEERRKNYHEIGKN